MIAIIALALVVSGLFLMNTRIIISGKITWFLTFGAVFAVLLIPYFIFCLLSRLKNHTLVSEVGEWVSQEFRAE